MTRMTRGKWTVTHEFNVMAGKRQIASTGGHQDNTNPYTYEENKANAQAIAALPDMLEVCKAALELMSNITVLGPDSYKVTDMVDKLDAIITKVEGEGE